MRKPLVFALGVAFSGSVLAAAPDEWINTPRVGAICRPLLPKNTEPTAAKKSGEPALPEGYTRIVSDKSAGQIGARHRADGDVIIERNGQTLNAQWADYDQPTDNVHAGDKFTLTDADGQTVTGNHLTYNLNTKSGTADDSAFVSDKDGRRLQGASGKVVMDDENHQQMQNVVFNTCDSGDRSWYIQAKKVKINREIGIGVAEHAKLIFAGIPILYSPWMDFPINGQRKSGLLFPTIGSGSNGLTYKQPYYLNLAPNYDATITPGIMASRGATLSGEFRYLQPNYSGILIGEYMPNDSKSEYDNRYVVHFKHNQKILDNWSAGVDYNQASDDDYYRDFSGRTEIAESENLNREAWLSYTPKVWGETLAMRLSVQKYQPLYDTNGYKSNPYAIMPRLLATWSKTDGNAQINLFSQFTRFESIKNSQQDGVRAVIYPNVKWDFHNDWLYVRPKIGLHATRYWLDELGSKKARNLSRVLPMFNVDTGMTLEREMSLGGLFGAKNLVQTLEPRLFYNYIPYKSQNDLPNFDTSENEFSYEQLFRENAYSGNDRINASNSVSMGVQTRILDKETGEEKFRAGLGQKYYLDSNDIVVQFESDENKSNRSDFIGFLAGQVSKNWYADTHVHWSESNKALEHLDSGIRYHPEPGKVVSVRYKYGRNEEIYSGFYDKLKQIDLAAQWPISDSVYAVGRLNYGLTKDKRKPLEQTLGFEYKNPCGCWSATFVAQRYVSSLKEYKNAFFFTLQLRDLSTVGNDPMDTLSTGIPSYFKTNNVGNNPTFKF